MVESNYLQRSAEAGISCLALARGRWADWAAPVATAAAAAGGESSGSIDIKENI